MSDLSEYFSPIDLTKFRKADAYFPTALGKIVKAYTAGSSFPELEDVHLAIIGVEEDRRSVNNEGCGKAPDFIRENLYQLYQGNYSVKIADLGNITKGTSVNDSYFALTTVVSELLKKNIVPIIIGGGQDLTYANYRAYEKLEQFVNMVTVDASFDLGFADCELNSQSYLGKIILQQPNYLFNYSNIGYQTYFVDQDSIQFMSKLYFDIYRLGQVRSDLEEVEPIVRNADMLSFDISSIRCSDAPGSGNASPNGFYGEEACQIARYAGMSDKLSSIGFYEVNPAFDKANQTAHLVAQIIWCFIDGYYNRKKDFPFDHAHFTKYMVSIKNHKYEIIFYKSNKSDRWWMKVPYHEDKKIKYEQHHLIPCSYNDYQTACKDDMPDRWWQNFKKLS